MLWNIAYLLIFPSYACLFSLGRNWFEKHLSIVPFVGALASFLIGQLVELPFLLVGKTITWVYPVSYTHLDVYKRQAKCSTCFAGD